jgi:hypothetical protein
MITEGRLLAVAWKIPPPALPEPMNPAVSLFCPVWGAGICAPC